MDELLEHVPFNCLIVGPTNCGKSHFLLEKLRGTYKDAFDAIVLICPTYARNKTYEGVEKEFKRLVVFSPSAKDDEAIDQILDDVRIVFSGRNTLIIVDDCAMSNAMKRRTSSLVDLAFSGRHGKLSTWVLTQQLTSISKPFRDNVQCVIAFHTPAEESNKALWSEFGGNVSNDERRRFAERQKRMKRSRLCFSTIDPFHMYLEAPSPAQMIQSKDEASDEKCRKKT